MVQIGGRKNNRVVSHEEWLAARKTLLAQEKEFTRARDALSKLRRELPWEKIDKAYVFAGPSGEVKLGDLFDRKSQLVVQHVMFAPENQEACEQCSFWCDNFERNVVHLAHRDVAYVAVSRAPVAKIEAMKQRMGWTFPWFSSGRSDFNFDFNASWRADELRGDVVYNYVSSKQDGPDREGLSVFYRDATGAIFHTYSTYARGIDLLNTTYNTLDLVPKGRDEVGIGPGWVRHRDRYE
jgi:predicted dithiol-disulfide oxidoreductase (DUF899 family)